MAAHNELGKEGELMALNYLKGKGYQLLETNFRWGKQEIDIIALDKDQIVIAEVKTRTSNAFAEPEANVNLQKQKFLIRAANGYVVKNRIPYEVRFDIISILIAGAKSEIRHIENAFTPSW